MSAVRRGCGTRVAGGVYAEVEIVPEGGFPFDTFLVDPAHKIDHASVPKRGVKLVEPTRGEESSAWHVLDWIGEGDYPNLFDFIEESRRIGLSRRLPANFPFERLSIGSRLLCVHARARLSNHAALSRNDFCPTNNDTPHDPCLGWGTEVLTCGTALDGEDLDNARSLGLDTDRAVWRQMPSFGYSGFAPPDWFIPEFEAGVFAVFPISRIVVIDGGKAAGATFDNVQSKSVLPVTMVQE